jgi:hypothetical protein
LQGILRRGPEGALDLFTAALQVTIIKASQIKEAS